MRWLVTSASLWLALSAGARAEPRFDKAPYLMDAQPTSMAVLFELNEPSTATVVARSADGREVRADEPAQPFHEVVLEGLEPRTAYDYRVILPGGRTAEGSFVTAPPPGEGPIDFLVMGDNRTDAAAHEAIVRAMSEHPADFVVNTGDMVADGSDASDWRRMFHVEAPLLRDVPLFPTLGNHELYQSGRGLESFLLYTRVPRELGGGDTYYGFSYGPVRFLVLDSNQDWSGESEQRRWLEEQLALADASPDVDHILVLMHHGPFSSGRHGPQRDMLASDLIGLFRRYHVSLVLSGHDHMYERGEAGGVKYIVTGGGGAPLYPINQERRGQLAFQPTYHFLRITVDGPSLMMTAVRPDGSEIERCGFEGTEPWRCEGPAHPGNAGLGPIAASQSPALFWLGEALRRPAVWVFLALVVAALVTVIVLRRRGARARQSEAESQSSR